MAAEYIVLAILIVLAAVFIGLYIFKKQNHNNIAELKARKKSLLEGVPTQKLEEVRDMEISGQSLSFMNRLEEDWKKIQSGKNITVENNIFEAEQSNNRYRFSDSKNYQQKAYQEMEIIEQDLKKLTSSLDEIIYRPEANQKRIEEIQEKYQTIRKQLLANSFSYGEAVEDLENKLADMEKEFTSYEHLTESGDYEEARKVIIRLETMIKNMEKYMDDIPQILNRIENEFEGQLEEIEMSHAQLTEEGFVFPGTSIQSELEAIEEQIVKLNEIAGNLEINEANILSERIASNIDLLYERMEIEIEARQEVYELLTEVNKAIYYLTEEVRILFFEIDRVSQSYVLVYNEQDQINDLRDEVSEVAHQYERLEDSLESNFISYSEAEEVLNNMKEELIKINEDKEGVTNQLYNYRDEELRIKEEVTRMEHKVRDIRRTLDRENLPGVSTEYFEYYNYVSHSLVSLSEELARPKLKVEKIHDLYEICKEEVDNLEARTQRVIDNAALTEMFAQRLYRHRNEYPEVAQVIEQSETYFNEDFDYGSSITVVRNKLKEIEPSAVEEIENNYFNQ